MVMLQRLFEVKQSEILKLTFSQRFSLIMEGICLSGDRVSKRPNESPAPSPLKRTNFVGISPLKELTNVKTPSDRPFRVSIEGNIGAGKSTLVDYFGKLDGIEIYPEPIAWWRNCKGYNLLDLMYTDAKKWLNVFQSHVLLSRLKLQTSKPQSLSTRVQMFERSVQNTRYCFMEQAHKSGFLKDADYSVLDQWYRWVRANSDINLDLIVYLRSTPEVVYERVKSRGRPEETGITLEYLTQLHESHERWLMTDDERFNTIPVLVLDANATLNEIQEQYKSNQNKILGYDKKGIKRIDPESKDKVKKNLNLD